MVPRKRIGEMLIEAGIVDETQLKAALGHQRKWGVRLGQALVDLKLAAEPDIVRVLAAKFGCEIVRLEAIDARAQEQALKLFPREFALRNNLLPVAAETGVVTVAMSDPTNLAVLDEISFRTGRRVKVFLGGDRQIAQALERAYPRTGEAEVVPLDLGAEQAIEGEAVFDAFGGGSNDAAASAAPEELTPLGEADVDLASDLAPAAGDGAAGRELTPRDTAVLDALERLAEGAQPSPEIVKPAQAAAAMIRILIRKGIVTEEEFLDELRGK